MIKKKDLPPTLKFYPVVEKNCDPVRKVKCYWYEPIIIKLRGFINKEKLQCHKEVRVRTSIVRKDILQEVGVYVCDSLVGPSQQWLSKLILEAASGHLHPTDGFIMKMLTHRSVALGLLSSATELSASSPLNNASHSLLEVWPFMLKMKFHRVICLGKLFRDTHLNILLSFVVLN